MHLRSLLLHRMELAGTLGAENGGFYCAICGPLRANSGRLLIRFFCFSGQEDVAAQHCWHQVLNPEVCGISNWWEVTGVNNIFWPWTLC